MVTYYVEGGGEVKGKETMFSATYSALDINDLRKKIMQLGKTYAFHIWDKNRKYLGYIGYSKLYNEGWIWRTDTNVWWVAKNGRVETYKKIIYPQYKR